MLPEQQQRIMGYFIEEAKDHLNTIEQGLLNLQSTIEDQELVNEVFRAAHSVKGGAAMLGLSSIQQTAHRLEDSFKVLKECEGVKVDQKLESYFLRVFDTMSTLIEQLSGPFGLTEETADQMLKEVEPVFQELNNHLAQIVKQSGGVWEASELYEPETVMVGAIGGVGSRNLSVVAPLQKSKAPVQAKEESALQLIFRSDVTDQLRQMLQAFKRPEGSESRQQLDKICSNFKAAGEQFELRNWAELIGTVERAIANPENTYRTLAQVVIRDIKQAQELIVAGREAEIAPGQNLLALLPPEPAIAEENDSELEDLLAFADDYGQGETAEETLWDLTGVEFNEEEDDGLEELAENSNNSTDSEMDLDEIFNKVESSTNSGFEWGDGSDSYHETMLQFDDGTPFGTPDQEALSFKGSSRSGPEVGIAELNTLADLFEGDTPDLDGTWEEEDDIPPEMTSGEAIGLPPLDDDNSGDFTDLLFDEEEQQKEVVRPFPPTDDLTSLFGGDFMLGEEEGEGELLSGGETQNPENSESLLDLDVDDDDLTELLAIAPVSETDNNQELEADFSNEQQTEISSLDMIPNLDEEGELDGNWFTDSLDQEEAETALPELGLENSDLDALFGDGANFAEESEAEEIASSRAAVESQDSDFDELFGSEPDLGNDDLEAAGNVENWLDLESANDLELPSLDMSGENAELSDWEGFGEDEEIASALSTTSNNDTEDSNELELLDELLESEGDFDLEMENDLGELSEIGDVDEIPVAPDNWLETEMDLLGELEVSESADTSIAVTENPAEEGSWDDLLDSKDAEVSMNSELASEATKMRPNLTSQLSANDSDNELSDSDSLGEDFADLEAMLSEVGEIDDSDQVDDALQSDVFSDLEDLLIDSEDGAPEATVASISGKISASVELEDSTDDEFGDLGILLDQIKGQAGSGRETMMGQASRNARPNRRSFEQTMRVPVKQLDNLSNLMGELVVNRNSLEQDQERMRQFLDNLLHQVSLLSDVGARMQDLYERSLLEISLLATRQAHRNTWQPEAQGNDQHSGSSSNRFGFSDIELDRFTPFHSQSQEIIELIVRVRESAADIEFLVDEADQVTRQLRQVTTQLQEGLTRARMMPFAQTADRLPRAVRDISIKCGKQAQLVVEGKDTLIDKMILEQLYDPMTHLVNNAITHGIETPDVRQAGGKPAVGKITIRVFHQGNQTVISISDDGAGIDPQKVKAKALKQGLITAAGAQKMSRADVYDLLFMPGFSTQEQATEFAGRGVGMDVVRTSLSEIRGSISIDSTVGKGTVFTIRLPLTLSISKALCCISDRARIAFPMDGVEDMIDVPREQVQVGADGQHSIEWRGSMLPFRHLRELLGYNRYLGRGSVYGFNADDDMISVIVLRTAGIFLAVQVDQVSTEQEIVIKQLEGPVPKPVGIAGATVLGDGRIVAIADVLELIDLATGRLSKEAGGAFWDENNAQPPAEAPPDKNEPTVLIVDDSITVRSLLSITFEKSGYRVEEARDGKEAWEKLKSGLPCDIVFCDIEMPRMDGLELLSRMQKDSILCELPIAMLTSRGADRHRQMAYSLGARGYFTKPYLEEHLLDAASRMLKGEVVGAPAPAGA
ncbi:response regulator [Kamptonema sp. UHCC 0994]|uniref:hybrid sensor histidine kinase/response regulator n=1 Tax=Kamptonema sp. UHCC 0994 TaxID=3031329 RepID=UPI0023BAA206|nr:response regulator [Kamptonema sp. UHCC 0994]MDF0556698.1 response regulator [Kamptonema sp. UHCC 0994]